jgi:hypothetical protein
MIRILRREDVYDSGALQMARDIAKKVGSERVSETAMS